MSTDSRGRPFWISITEKCTHFNGLMNKTCKAGVTYDAVKRQGEPMRASLPCFIAGESVPCAERYFPTEEEAKAQEAESEAHIKAYFEDIHNGICPICKKPITKKQVGRCVYADPCGHRLYQGTLPKGERR